MAEIPLRMTFAVDGAPVQAVFGELAALAARSEAARRFVQSAMQDAPLSMLVRLDGDVLDACFRAQCRVAMKPSDWLENVVAGARALAASDSQQAKVA